ncbi:MAG: chromate transporter, partial [Candidatus Eremiobacteraeota bacterium]|nr:chromate transporter [Candidatus Eremiobacteraeota bacterium]
MVKRAPLRPLQLFFGFATLGVISFGGAITMARRYLVDQRHWLEPAEFNDVLGLGQVLPGPNVVNASVIIGAREAGPFGAAAALAGILLPPLAIVLVLAT